MKCDICGRATDNRGPMADLIICDRVGCVDERRMLQWRLHNHEDWRHYFSFQGRTPEHSDKEIAAAVESEYRLGAKS